MPLVIYAPDWGMLRMLEGEGWKVKVRLNYMRSDFLSLSPLEQPPSESGGGNIVKTFTE